MTQPEWKSIGNLTCTCDRCHKPIIDKYCWINNAMVCPNCVASPSPLQVEHCAECADEGSFFDGGRCDGTVNCCLCHGIEDSPLHLKTGYRVDVMTHTNKAKAAITSPEALRFMIGHMLDSWKLQEEIDYTLEVSRIYDDGEVSHV